MNAPTTLHEDLEDAKRTKQRSHEISSWSSWLRGVRVAAVGRAPTLVCVIVALCCASVHGQEIQPEQKARVDAAVPRKAPAKPRQPRRMLVTNLSMRDGKPARGSSAATIPVGN